MPYITFEEYKELGGEVDFSTFPQLEKKAEKYMDYFTQDRLKKATVIISDVKECMVEFIDCINNFNTTETVSSFSNDGISVNFSEKNNKANEQILFDIAEIYLPIELIARAVNT